MEEGIPQYVNTKLTLKELKPILLRALEYIEYNIDDEQYIHVIEYNGKYPTRFYLECNKLEIGIKSSEKAKSCLLFFLYVIKNRNFDLMLDVTKSWNDYDYCNQAIVDLIDLYSREINWDDNIKVKTYPLDKINDIDLWDVKHIKEYVEQTNFT